MLYMCNVYTSVLSYICSTIYTHVYLILFAYSYIRTYVYTAIAKPALLSAKGSSKQFLFTTSMSNKEWIENTGESTYFIYPIHSSGCFMASKSIASSLYLVLIRLMTRKYEDAFVLIEGCVSDIALSKQGMYVLLCLYFVHIYALYVSSNMFMCIE